MNAVCIKKLTLLIIGLSNFFFQTITPMKRAVEATKYQLRDNTMVLFQVYEQLLHPVIMEKDIHKVILDRCVHENGHVSSEALLTFNGDYKGNFKHYKTNIEAKIAFAKNLRAMSKALCHKIELEELYALEKAYLKINILTQLLKYTNDATKDNEVPDFDLFNIKIGYTNIKGIQIEIDTYIKNQLKETIVSLNKLYNFGYKRGYQQKHALLNKCAPKINNILFCITLFAIQYQPLYNENNYFWCEPQEYLDAQGQLTEIQETIEAHQNFSLLSLFLFADHQKNQKGLCPASLFVETDRNVIPLFIRNIIKQNINLFYYETDSATKRNYPAIKSYAVGAADCEVMSSDSDGEGMDAPSSDEYCFDENSPFLQVSFAEPIINTAVLNQVMLALKNQIYSKL
ncbi:hypothetical protein IPH25_01795 [bacterium]|nr:MAG: hypothetical protein IPG37_03925 [bacterium]QQR62158.1 MAG: hypothetical protein IPH25_01795 [bacterium]QQR63286.1 MAG: hypothetical protein IPH67_02315 [bacterium]